MYSHPAIAQDGSGTWSFQATLRAANDSSGAVSSLLSDSKPLTIGADGSGSATAKAQGQAEIIATWTSPYTPTGMPTPTPTPPATVSVLLTSGVQAWGPYGSTYGIPSSTGFPPLRNVALSSPQLDDGFGDPVVLQYDHLGDYSDLGAKQWQCSGVHLKTFSTKSIAKDKDPATRKWTVVLPATSMSAILDASASGYNNSQGSSVGTLNVRVLGFPVVQPINAALTGHSTADTANWDASSPRFFSGTNCTAQAVAVAASGYVSHAQLLINGTIVREYWDTSISPPAYSLAGYVSTGANQTSASLGAAFDSTHFSDGSTVQIKLLVEDTQGNKYTGQISGNAYNKAEALVNNNPEWSVSSGLPSVVSGAMTNYTCPTSDSLQKNDILALLPSLSAFYISSHGNAGVIGDCDALSEIKYIDSVTHQPASYVNSFTYMYADGDPTQAQGGVDISTKIGQKSLMQPPMNFVFLDGCLTAGDQSSASAFGAAGTDRAFLGWLNSYYINAAHRDWTTRLMQGLSGGSTLRDAMIDATANGPTDGEPLPIWPAPTTPSNPVSDGPPGVPYYYGDGGMTLHGVYGGSPTHGWIKPQ